MVKFLDIKAINDSFQPLLSHSIKRATDSGWYLLGSEVNAFEKEYARYIGVKHCIGVANGLDALRLIFKAYIEMGVMKVGDEIIVPANTFIATILAITDNRLRPVLVEPDIHTYNLDISIIEKHLTSKTRAIMVVHLYGQSCWSPLLKEIALKYDLMILEDNAQAAGAMIDQESILPSHSEMSSNLKPFNLNSERRTGSLGIAAGHSFYPGKNLGALGDGGAVTTDDDELASMIRMLGNYGYSKKYNCNYKGVNSRLDEIQAAVLRVKLKRLDSDNQHRREIAQYYLENISNTDIILPSTLSAQRVTLDRSHVWHLFIIRSNRRDHLQKYLTDHEIQTLIHYPVPPHKQQAFREWNRMSLPITEKIHNEVLSLPISQVMSIEDANTVVKYLNMS